MKLFCSECRCFFEDNEIVVKVISGNAFNYYHKACCDVSDVVVATLSLKKVIEAIEAIEGKYEGQKMYRKVCAYHKCEAVFVTKNDRMLFCNKECNRLYFNEIKKVQKRDKRAKAKGGNIMDLELAICCNKETKQIGKPHWIKAANTQSVYSICKKCKKKYYNWYQPDPAGNSGGSQLVKEEN